MLLQLITIVQPLYQETWISTNRPFRKIALENTVFINVQCTKLLVSPEQVLGH